VGEGVKRVTVTVVSSLAVRVALGPGAPLLPVTVPIFVVVPALTEIVALQVMLAPASRVDTGQVI
jgi:hypothetical protein